MWKYALLTILSCLLITSCAKQAVSASSTVSVPQLINTPPAYLQALATGQLALANGCLRLNVIDEISILLIWQPSFSARTEQGITQVVDNTGQVVASVGDYVEMSGGFSDDPTGIGLKEPLPKDCPGPYWLIGDEIRKIEKPYP